MDYDYDYDQSEPESRQPRSRNPSRDEPNWSEAEWPKPGAPAPIDLSPLAKVFRDQLIACLEECAAGRNGLFATTDYLGQAAAHPAWPEAARLRELAAALQAALAQSGEQDLLADQFLDLCSIHGESDPGEAKLARAFLKEIASGVQGH